MTFKVITPSFLESKTAEKKFKCNGLSERCEKIFFTKEEIPPKSSLSGHSVGSLSVISNCLSFSEAGQSMASEVGNYFPLFRYSNFIKTLINSNEISFLNHLYGSTSLFNLVLGLFQLKHAKNQTNYALSNQDSCGVLLGRISQLKGFAVALSGVFLTVFRFSSFYEIINKKSSKDLISRVNAVSLQGSFTIYSLFCLFSVGYQASSIYEKITFLQELNSKGTSKKKIAWLKNFLDSNPLTILNRLIEEHGLDKTLKILTKEALDTVKDNLFKLIKDLEAAELSEEEIFHILLEFMKQSSSSGDPKKIDRKKLNSKLIKMGLEIRVKKEELKNLSTFRRIFGQEGPKIIQEIKKLKGRVSKESSEKLLLGKIYKAVKSKIIGDFFSIGLCLLSLSEVILSLVLSGGPFFFISVAVTMAFSVVNMLLDGYGLYKSYKNEVPGSQDKNLIVFSTCMAIVSTIIFIAFASTGLGTIGTFPMVASAVLSFMWFSQNALTYWVINKNEKYFQQKKPTLDIFLNSLKSNENKEYIEKMHKNLPKDLKVMLDEALKDERDMKKAAISVSEMIEASRKVEDQEYRKFVASALTNGNLLDRNTVG